MNATIIQSFSNIDTNQDETTGNNGSHVLVSVVSTKEGLIRTYQKEGDNKVFFHGVSIDSTLIEKIIRPNFKDVFELLLRAVNNRTKERNYFRLYCEMLEETISEDEFNKELDENESNYVLDGDEEPTEDKMRIALGLSTMIKDVNTSEDISSLFSFDSTKTDKVIKAIENVSL